MNRPNHTTHMLDRKMVPVDHKIVLPDYKMQPVDHKIHILDVVADVKWVV